MKIRLTCSFFGCLHDHLHGFTEPVPLHAVHAVIYPDSLGLESEARNWSLEFLLSLAPESLERLVRRLIETGGQAETLDLLIGLPDPVCSRLHPLGNDILLLVERLEVAFASHKPLDWLFVSPKRDWLERLSQYHQLRAAPPGGAAIFDGESFSHAIEQISQLGFPFAELAPEDILPLLASRFYGLIPPTLPSTIEGFATYVLDDALRITSSLRIFGAWQGIQASPLASQLPEGWEVQLGKYGHLIPLVLRHLAPDAFGIDAPVNP